MFNSFKKLINYKSVLLITAVLSLIAVFLSPVMNNSYDESQKLEKSKLLIQHEMLGNMLSHISRLHKIDTFKEAEKLNLEFLDNSNKTNDFFLSEYSSNVFEAHKDRIVSDNVKIADLLSDLYKIQKDIDKNDIDYFKMASQAGQLSLFSEDLEKFKNLSELIKSEELDLKEYPELEKMIENANKDINSERFKKIQTKIDVSNLLGGITEFMYEIHFRGLLDTCQSGYFSNTGISCYKYLESRVGEEKKKYLKKYLIVGSDVLQKIFKETKIIKKIESLLLLISTSNKNDKSEAIVRIKQKSSLDKALNIDKLKFKFIKLFSKKYNKNYANSVLNRFKNNNILSKVGKLELESLSIKLSSDDNTLVKTEANDIALTRLLIYKKIDDIKGDSESTLKLNNYINRLFEMVLASIDDEEFLKEIKINVYQTTNIEEIKSNTITKYHSIYSSLTIEELDLYIEQIKTDEMRWYYSTENSSYNELIEMIFIEFTNDFGVLPSS